LVKRRIFVIISAFNLATYLGNGYNFFSEI